MKYSWLDTATVNTEGELQPSPLMRVALFCVVLLVAPFVVALAMLLMVVILCIIALLIPVIFLVTVSAPLFGIFKWLADLMGVYRFIGPTVRSIRSTVTRD